jgi:F0F1-type ATP synthase assembly protein I
MEKNAKPQQGSTLPIIIGMSTAILLVTPVLILLVLGYIVDNIFHTTPFYMIGGIIVGFISGVINVFRLMKLMQRRKVNQHHIGNE